jgi:beta-galactosidase/beta-glucuronidase
VLGGLTLDYVNWFWGAPYEDASRMFKEYIQLGAPAVKWKYHFDKEAKAEELGWTKPDFDDKAWKTTHVVEETWSTLGLHQSMGWMAYRAKMGFNQIPEGKKVYLWIGSTDGSAKVFVNGHHVKYVVPEKTRRHEKGEVLDSFSGYCQPAVFDITPYAKPGQNQVTILCQRTWLNELGTGGLMGPVIVFREK